MKKYFFYIAVASLTILLSVVIVSFIKKLQQLKNENEKMSEYLQKTNDLFTTFSETLNTIVTTDNMLFPNIEIIDNQGNNKTISEIIEKEKILIYLPQISCNTCTERETELVKAIFEKNVKDVIIVSNFQSLREQIVFERAAQIASYSFKQGESFPIQGLEKSTVIFLVSKTLQAHCVLLPNEKTDKISEIYYRAVAKRFKDKNQE